MHVEKRYRVLESHLEGDVTVIDKVEFMSFAVVPAGTKFDLSLLGRAEIMSEHEQHVEPNEDGSVTLPQTAVQVAILERLAQRFTHFTFKTFPGIETPEGVVLHALCVQRGPKDDWFKLHTKFPAEFTPESDEQTMRQIERELHSWGDGTSGTREEPDGTPQYPKIKYP